MVVCIHKFSMSPLGGDITVDMPVGARVLSVGFQGTELCLWAIVDTRQPRAPHRFFVATTGEDLAGISHELCFGRAETLGGGYVVHVFMQGPAPWMVGDNVMTFDPSRSKGQG